MAADYSELGESIVTPKTKYVVKVTIQLVKGRLGMTLHAP